MQLLPTFVALASLFTSVQAHVTANPSVAKPGSYFVTSFRVPHGCSKSPTVNVTIQIPSDVKSATPQMIAGWKISYGYGPLDTPIPQEDGTLLNTTVTSVSYTGNSLPHDQYADFGLSVKLPATTGNNNTLYFPVTQVCENGTNLWTAIPGSEKPAAANEIAAPKVTLVNDTSSNGTGGSGAKGSSGVLSIVPTSAVLVSSLAALFAAL